MIASKINSSYIDRELRTHMDFLEGYLAEVPAGGDFFCGSTLSGADFQMIFPLEGAFRRVPLTEANYPKLHNYVRRMQGRDAYKKAAQRASEAAGEEYVPFSDMKE
jgi:glutathione S-transferase